MRRVTRSGTHPLHHAGKALPLLDFVSSYSPAQFHIGTSSGDYSAEKHHQEEFRRAAAESTKRHKDGLALTGKEHWLVGSEARAKFLWEVEPSYLDHFPWEICIHATVTGYNEHPCWFDQLFVGTAPV